MEEYHGILSDLSEVNDLMTGMFGKSKDYFLKKLFLLLKRFPFLWNIS